MEIKILASGSKGNCYKVSDGKTSLLIECGISIKEIKKRLDFKLSEIDGCLITHCHQDHCKAVKDITKSSIDAYMSNGTINKLGVEGHRIHAIKAKKQFTINTFSILPFDIQHDAPEPLGFLIQSIVTKEKLLFLTDTYYCKYVFNGLTHIMVECNYSKEDLEENYINGVVDLSLKNRLYESHMSLENLTEFLTANDLSIVKKIYLIHLSNKNSNADKFKAEIQKLTGKEVIVA
jgi:phosphoribosyl 1,2-cyclic phosphodiesterase